MFEVQLGESVPCGITTHSDSGANVDADALPTITVYRNGSAVVALTAQAMTKLATGLYDYAFTPTTAGGFAAGDRIKVVATSTVGAVTSSIVLKELKAVTWRTVDGLSINESLEAVQAMLFGIREVADNVITCMGRDGVTPDGTVTLYHSTVYNAVTAGTKGGYFAAVNGTAYDVYV